MGGRQGWNRGPFSVVPRHRDPFEASSGAKGAVETGRNRLILAGALFLAAYGAIGLRLMDLALVKAGREPTLAESADRGRFQAERRDITDRNGVLLATNLATASLFADSTLVPDPAAAAAGLATVLPGLDAAETREKLGSGRRFVWIRRNLTPEQQYAVNRLGLPGLSFQREARRVFPQGALAAHVTGFSGIDNGGLAGIEKHLDAALAGGSAPLALALDLRVQHLLREELLATISDFNARGGMGLVMDVRTGEILALVSLPDFEPNHPATAAPDSRFNRASLGVYEMGSTFKIFTIAMALESETATLESGYDATNPIRVSRFVIEDFHPQRRWLTVPEIFLHSSNIGAAKMALDVGTEFQREFFRRLGFLEPIRLELPEAGRPIVPSPWREINTLTTGYGHGMAITPIHLASGVASIVNGGRLVHPTLLMRSVSSAGTKVVSPRTSAQIRALMRLVVTAGTGKQADVPGYVVGGKTGTAEKSGAGGYSRKALMSSFVGVFPMNAPRYVVLVMVDEPKANARSRGYATGGWVAAPTVGRVIGRMAPLLGVSPEIAAEPAGLEWVDAKGSDRKLASY